MRFKKTGFIVSAGLLVITPIVARAAAGDLDSGFGDDGIVTTDFNGEDDVGQATLIQTDGRIVVVGTSHNGINNDIAVVRYNSDGSLDYTFNGDGKVTTPIGGGAEVGASVALQYDGKIVVAGHSYNGSNFDFAVVRYNTDGSLDNTFDGDGKVTTPIGGSEDYGRSVSIQNDGKIVVAGSSYNGSNFDFAVVRYDTDGSLDNTFDIDGKVTTPIGSGTDNGLSLDIQDDGKLVVAGYSHNGFNNDFAVVRYKSDGSLDDTFSGDGVATTAIGSSHDGGSSVAIQDDGKIIVAGNAVIDTFDEVVVRYNSDGTLDNTFDGDGLVIRDLTGDDDFVTAVAIGDSGKVAVAGYSFNGSNNDFTVVRYNTDGSPDISFGSNGLVITNISSVDDVQPSVAIQNDEDIIIAGSSYLGGYYDFAVIRYWGRNSIHRGPTVRTLVLDAAGGICSGEHTSWKVRFRGTYTLPTDCTRDGYVFIGWTRDPALTTPEHLLTDTISRSANLTAVWGALPAAPASVKVLANFLCGRDCTSALVVWPVVSDTALITVDGLEATCSTRGEGLELRWCLVAGLASGTNHTASVSLRNQYGVGPATTTAFTLL